MNILKFMLPRTIRATCSDGFTTFLPLPPRPENPTALGRRAAAAVNDGVRILYKPHPTNDL